MKRLLWLALLLAASTAGAGTVSIGVGAGDCRPQAVGALTYGAAPTCLTATATPTSTATPTATNTPTPTATPIALPLSLANGGTHADLSGTGGTSRVLKQVSAGADITVAQLACSDLSNASATCATAGMTTSGSNAASTVVAADWSPDAVDSRALGSVTVPWTKGFFGESSTLYGFLGWSKTDTVHHFRFETDSTNRTIAIIDKANDAFNYATASASHPTVKIYSVNQNTTQWIDFFHDGTDGNISVGTGKLQVTGPTQVVFANGSAAAPSVTFTGRTTSGLYLDTNTSTPAIARSGVEEQIWGAGYAAIPTGNCYTWATLGSTTGDTGFCRDSAGLARVTQGVTAAAAGDLKLRSVGNGATATISTGGCTSPSVSGGDLAGDVTVGSSCTGIKTVTVSFSSTKAAAPICFVQDITANPPVLMIPGPTTTTLVITQPSAADLVAAHHLQYHCIGV